MLKNLLESVGKKIDFWLLATTAFLVFFGLVAIYDSSVVSAQRDFGDKLFYFKNQSLWALLGLGSLVFFSYFNYHRLVKMGPVLLASSLVLLVMVLIPGIGSKIYGARRWISLGIFNFQPSELAKLAIILFQVNIMSKFENYKMYLKDTFLVFFLPTFLIIALVFLEPDLGTALIFAMITLIVYFLASAPIWHFFLAIPPLLAAGFLAVILEPYRLNRLKTFLDPAFDPQGASYQINQILTAITRGGFLGVGIGQSRSKFAFIPEVQTDAIFAIIVEELGTIGALFIIAVFFFLLTRGFTIAKEAKDFEGKLLALAISSLIGIQVFFNIGANVALVPLTGIPLPFISYGGTSLILNLTMIGILINIKKQSGLR